MEGVVGRGGWECEARGFGLARGRVEKARVWEKSDREGGWEEEAY